MTATIQPYLSRLNTQGSLVTQLRTCFEDKTEPRDIILSVKEVLNGFRAGIRTWNSAGASGSDTVKDLSAMVDTLIRVLWDHVEMQIPVDENTIAMVAVGGYGRMELCPQSDVDLLILTHENPSKGELNQAEEIIRHLWDFGFVVGSSVRSVTQCVASYAEHPEVWTSFLNERFLAGNYELYRKFISVTRKNPFPGKIPSLIKEKAREREHKKSQAGSLVQLLEPNIKEAPGGLRDVHTLLWVAKLKHDCNTLDDLVRYGLVTPQELEDLRAAYDFLLRVRCCLHFINNRKDDHLSFHLQPEVAQEFGFQDGETQKAVEVFLKLFYTHTRVLNRVTSVLMNRWLMPKQSVFRRDKLKKNHPHFRSLGGILDIKEHVGNPFVDNPILILEYFDISNRENLSYDHHAHMRIRQAVRRMRLSPEERRPLLRYFLELCKKPQRVGRMLRAMNDVEFIGLLIPDFNHIYCHSQHDIYHIYTTDEHTLSVVRQLAYLPQSTDPILAPIRESLKNVVDLDVLILACFFHDIGKGVGSHHSISGAKMAYAFLESMDFSPASCREASHLVLNHLLMNEVIQRRDLDDPKTIRNFVSTIDSEAALHKLYVLTYCDVASVHPDAWSGWKSTLLEKLYRSALAEFEQPFQVTAEGLDMRQAILEQLSGEVEPQALQYHLATIPELYVATFSPEEIKHHIALIARLDQEPYSLKISVQESYWEISLVAHDEDALLCRVTGSMSRAGLSILGARIFTRTDGIALDKFVVVAPPVGRNNPSILEKRLLEELRKGHDTTLDRLDMENFSLKDMPRPVVSVKPIEVTMPAEVSFSNEFSDTYSTIDLTCKDQIGLFYRVAKVFYDCGLKVHGAVLTTEADKASDAFYVTDRENKKIGDDETIEKVMHELRDQLST